MKKFNPDGSISFVLPLGGFARARDYPTGRALIDEILGVPKLTTEPAASVATDTSALIAASLDETAFDVLVADLEKTLGPTELERVFSASDRAAARSDPKVRQSFSKTLRTWRELHARGDALLAIDSAKAEVASDEKERGRLVSLARAVGDAEHAARGAK